MRLHQSCGAFESTLGVASARVMMWDSGSLSLQMVPTTAVQPDVRKLQGSTWRACDWHSPGMKLARFATL